MNTPVDPPVYEVTSTEEPQEEILTHLKNSLTKKWSTLIQIVEGTTELKDADFSISDSNNETLFKGKTGTRGETPVIEITEYVQNGTGKYYKTPHTIQTTNKNNALNISQGETGLYILNVASGEVTINSTNNTPSIQNAVLPPVENAVPNNGASSNSGGGGGGSSGGGGSGGGGGGSSGGSYAKKVVSKNVTANITTNVTPAVKKDEGIKNEEVRSNETTQPVQESPAQESTTQQDKSTIPWKYILVVIVIIILIVIVKTFGLGQPKLQKAIRENLKNGFSKKEVEKALVSAGWNREQVREELKK